MRIFVGNLAYTTTEEELHRLFYGYGAVERTQIITDRETGRSRGFGFVEMPDASQAQAAIAGLNGTERGGRSLSVSEARARQTPPRHPCYQWELKPTGFSEGYKNLIPEKTIFTPC